MRRSRVTLFLALMLSATLACNFMNQVLEPQATLAPPPTLGGPTATPQAIGPATSTVEATPTLAAGETPAASLGELGAPPNSLEALRQWLSEAYDTRAALDEVCGVLREAQWAQTQDTCEGADLNGDGQEEWLVTLDVTHLQEGQSGLIAEGHPGDFWIVNQEGVIYMEKGPEPPDFAGTAPTLVALEDMSGDGQPEAVTVFSTCGAHTCYNYYQVIGAHEGEIRNLVQLPQDREIEDAPETFPTAIALSYVDLEEIREATDDELPDLVIRGGIVGSAGAGIQRSRTEIWAWSEEAQAIVRDRQEWEETDYRFHVLYNANYDFEQEAYDAAREGYEAVIVDASLEDIEWATGTAQEVGAYTRQFAAFRLALLPLLRGDITEATRWRNWLQNEYPQAPLAEAAEVLISEWQHNGNDLAAACQTVTEQLTAADNPTGPLTDMGYNNPSLEAQDVCPFAP